MMLNTTQLVALTLVPGLSSAVIRRLAETFNSLGRIGSIPPESLAQLGLKRSAIEVLGSSENRSVLQKEARKQIAMCSECGGLIVTWWDDLYPGRLREIYAAPTLLYCLGTLVPSDADGVAIVGTRGATTYGRLTAERYATSCATSGVVVVSGLARGIDSFAHASALRAGGRTVAVVASGLDRISPAPAQQLAEKIVQDGAVISEYPFGVQAMPAFFPQRNRIISGMTRGTLVVESDDHGGSMITAGFAMDQNREVFAVPGPVSSPKSRGTNLLIRTDRARLTQTPGDMLEALGCRINLQPEQERQIKTGELSVFEARVLESLGADPTQVDRVSELTDLSTSEVLVALLALEFKGLVRQLAGKMFVREG